MVAQKLPSGFGAAAWPAGDAAARPAYSAGHHMRQPRCLCYVARPARLLRLVAGATAPSHAAPRPRSMAHVAGAALWRPGRSEEEAVRLRGDCHLPERHKHACVSRPATLPHAHSAWALKTLRSDCCWPRERGAAISV